MVGMGVMRLGGICYESLTNGEGLRTVLFSQGCRHNCKGCFNPDTHDFNGGEEFTIQEINETIERVSPLIDGVTFSGGDPFEQAKDFAEIAKFCHSLGLNIWCYTGYTYEHLVEYSDSNNRWSDLLTNIDVLIDGKFIQELYDGTLKFKGSSNQRIIDVKLSNACGKVILYSHK